MSDGPRLPWAEAFELARQLSEELEPVCQRSKVAGSLRRKRPTVGDIEIVVEPHFYQDLACDLHPDLDPIRVLASTWGTVLVSGDRQVRVTDLLGRAGFKAELYLVHPPAQWGSILAIRTGPADLGKLAMTEMRRFGLRHRDGHVIQASSRRLVPTPTEQAFFGCAGMELVPPARRDELLEELLAARVAGER